MQAPAPTPSQVTQIGAGRVAVYDDLLAPAHCEQLFGVLGKSGFTRSEVARPETAQFRHWATEIPLQALPKMPFYEPTLQAVSGFDPQHRYRVYRSYVNAAFYGDMLFSHTDCLPGAGELTALWYVCARWDPEWGGETLFFDGAMDARAVVSPRPGRLVVFDGELTHVGRPPNRICTDPRYTLALKLERIAG
ncbi:MAG TPA: 2OG-Fe(II) oxygenase [Xanthomonadaceae bacterium]|nr:2OG-Fe(II) oxygenase [Xanthomonadaceae bacterium]